MTRLEFMKELESLLLDIPLDERNEALAYYNGYFDDAGEEQEEEIVKELGSPEKVAAIIKADLNTNSTDRESKGFFTEKGYQETIGSEFEIAKTESNQSNQKQANQNSTGQTNQNNNGQANFNYNNSGQANYNYNNNGANSSYTNYSNSQNGNSNNRNSNNGANYYSDHQKEKSGSNNVIFIILAIVTFPIWLPIVLTVLSVAIGVIATVVGLIFGFGVTGIALIGSGVVLFVAGLAELATPFYGLLMMGGGLVVLGLGMLLTIAVGFVCKKVVPVLISGFVNLCRLPFRNRRAMA